MTVSVFDASVFTSISIAAYFPVALGDGELVRPAGAVPLTWEQPGPWADLDLQPYGDQLLDRLLDGMPHAVVEARDLERGLRPGDGSSPYPLLDRPGGDDGERWRLVDARISLWNLHIGLLYLVYDVPVRAGTDLRSFVRRSRRVVRDMLPDVERFAADVITPADGGAHQAVSSLWSNAIYLVQVADGAATSATELAAIASSLVPDSQAVPVHDLSDTSIQVGINSCVVSTSLDQREIEIFLRLAGVHQVCWAAALRHDSNLHVALSEVQPDRHNPSLGRLEREATVISSLFHDVRTFRILYSSVEAHLEPAASAMWRALEEHWKFSFVLDSLDRRLDFLQTTHQQMTATLNGRYSRLLNELVLAFTFLSIVGLFLAIFTFAAMESLRVTAATAVAILLPALATAAAYVQFRRAIHRTR